MIDMVLAALGECNLHFTIYGAFGAHLLHAAFWDLRRGSLEHARAHMSHGALYLALGLQ